jgi:Fic family protein
MNPPYEITNIILNLIASISEKIGEVNAAHLHKPPTELRKINRIKTIQSSLEIEGNTLTVEQITALLNNKRILAPKKDILEVKNAIAVYKIINELNPFDIKSLYKAHKILMTGLIDYPGKFRSKTVGILKGSKIAHIAPPGEMVKPLLIDLFNYLKKDNDLLLIKSCVFHYEFEFIHPFMDGNGRMGRLWQTLILKKYSPVFEYLPIETIVKQRQADYYTALGESDGQGKSTVFIEFMLKVIEEALEELLKTRNIILRSEDRIALFQEKTGSEYFTRQNYMRVYKEISSATASRDLKLAVENGILLKSGDKRMSKYKFKRNNYFLN